MAATQPSILLPIFISGSHHKEYALFQQIQPAALVIAEMKERREAAEAAKKAKADAEKEASRKRKASDGGGSSRDDDADSVSLKELLDAGLIKAGTNNVTLTYKGVVYRASLTDSGQIDYDGQQYDDPDGFSLQVKQRQSDDGWRSVHVNGVSLEDSRHKYQQSKGAGEGEAAAAAQAAAEPTPSIYEKQLPEGELPALPSAEDALLPKDEGVDAEAGAEAEGEGEPDTSNWVQCSRCQTWRVVPDEFWPDIEAAGDEDWFCEEATWDLTLHDPFTKACKDYRT